MEFGYDWVSILGKRVSVFLPAPHLSPVVPICSYVDNSIVPNAIFCLLTLTLAVVGLWSGGESDNRAKANFFLRQNKISNKLELFAWYNVSSDGDNRKVAKGVGRNR